MFCLLSPGHIALSLCISSLLQQRAAAQWRPQVTPDMRSLDEIYEAAQQEEGPLNVVLGGDARVQGQYTVDAFQARFPKITLNASVDYSQYHGMNIDRSFYEGREYVDVALLQRLDYFPTWKKQNRLLYYKTQNYSLIDTGEKDLDGAWYPVNTFSFGSWVYDSTALSEDDLPQDFGELLDPKWKGKLCLTYPEDDAISYLFSTIVGKYGFDWINALAQQDVQWIRGTGPTAYLIDPAYKHRTNATDGQRVLTFTTIPSGVSDAIKIKPPSNDVYVSWLLRGGIFSSTKRPESAKLFISWYLSDEQQRAMAMTGTPTVYPYLDEVSGIGAHNSNVTDVDGYERYMSSRADAEYWRLQWELTLGPPQGPNSNLLYLQPYGPILNGTST